MNAKTIEWVIFGPLILFLLIAGWWSVGESHRRLDDPNDDRTLHLEELPGKLALFAHGVYRVTIFRQSGYVHAEELVTGSAQQALARAMATFRRAGIMAVHVGANSETELIIGRLYHDHRGRNEGKKVGRAHISLVEQAARPVRIPDPPRRDTKDHHRTDRRDLRLRHSDQGCLRRNYRQKVVPGLRQGYYPHADAARPDR